MAILRHLPAIFAVCFTLATPAFADDPPSNALPGPGTAKRSTVTPQDTLTYTVGVEAVPLADPEGKKLADIVATTYAMDRVEATKRPITYVFNGGPGAASAWLNFGGLGPKRFVFGNQGSAPSDLPKFEDNPDTWLAFTDLVFVDPPGTGYSRAVGADAERNFYSVEGDVDALSRVIAKHLAAKGRLGSPVYLAGESYGGFRAPRIAQKLQSRDGVGVAGIVSISPVLDFGIRQDEDISPIPWMNGLPSLVATMRERAGPITRADLADAEAYATGSYFADLMKGPRDKAAVDRMSAEVARLTGLDPAFVRRLGGRVDIRSFSREIGRNEGKVGSLYDANVTAFDPDPSAARSDFDDPVLDGAQAPLTRAAVDFYGRELNWKIDRRYELINGDVNRKWRWGEGQGAPEAISSLKAVLALDPKVKVIVAHGATDLVTPYMESKMALDQIPAFGDPERVRLKIYPGGHMFYTREGSRAAFLKDVKALYGVSAEE
ncbi:S10 family peptidase [Hansschlegelia quercus]|uniref:Peptidase S10 n=1 Tax=Hansschlegelia quercus TaxID=2528245 RepID=A0A4Q9GIZ0_9HYPH|nr:peptidase S10 [Hansschlegelia quercus]TBN54239.1 peptidase S10 [Hansschlegelia quercus]